MKNTKYSISYEFWNDWQKKHIMYIIESSFNDAMEIDFNQSKMVICIIELSMYMYHDFNQSKW